VPRNVEYDAHLWYPPDVYRKPDPGFPGDFKIGGGKPMRMRRVVVWIGHEMLEMLPVAAFFGIGFIVIVVTTNLVLADYALRFGNFVLVVTAALIVGKAVLVANATPFLRRYDTMPLAWTILYKAGVYCVFVLVARVVELNVEDWLGGRSFAAFLATFSWHRFLAIQIWLFVLFLVYVTFNELTQLLGEGELQRLLFNHRAPDLALGRRARTQALVQLSHLAAGHTPEELVDRASPAHADLVHLLQELAKG
jgi:hypothetical protein